MQVDFATIRDGRDRLSVFIGTLGWSRATYVEFVTDERWKRCSAATSARSTTSAGCRAKCSTILKNRLDSAERNPAEIALERDC